MALTTQQQALVNTAKKGGVVTTAQLTAAGFNPTTFNQAVQGTLTTVPTTPVAPTPTPAPAAPTQAQLQAAANAAYSTFLSNQTQANLDAWSKAAKAAGQDVTANVASYQQALTKAAQTQAQQATQPVAPTPAPVAPIAPGQTAAEIAAQATAAAAAKADADKAAQAAQLAAQQQAAQQAQAQALAQQEADKAAQAAQLAAQQKAAQEQQAAAQAAADAQKAADLKAQQDAQAQAAADFAAKQGAIDAAQRAAIQAATDKSSMLTIAQDVAGVSGGMDLLGKYSTPQEAIANAQKAYSDAQKAYDNYTGSDATQRAQLAATLNNAAQLNSFLSRDLATNYPEASSNLSASNQAAQQSAQTLLQAQNAVTAQQEQASVAKSAADRTAMDQSPLSGVNWGAVAGIALLAAGITDPELLSMADSGTLTEAALTNAGVDPALTADAITTGIEGGTIPAEAAPEIASTTATAPVAPEVPATLPTPTPVAPTPSPVVDTSQMIPTVDAAGNPGFFDPSTGQVVNPAGEVVGQTTMPQVGPGTQVAGYQQQISDLAQQNLAGTLSDEQATQQINSAVENAIQNGELTEVSPGVYQDAAGNQLSMNTQTGMYDVVNSGVEGGTGVSANAPVTEAPVSTPVETAPIAPEVPATTPSVETAPIAPEVSTTTPPIETAPVEPTPVGGTAPVETAPVAPGSPTTTVNPETGLTETVTPGTGTNPVASVDLTPTAPVAPPVVTPAQLAAGAAAAGALALSAGGGAAATAPLSPVQSTVIPPNSSAVTGNAIGTPNPNYVDPAGNPVDTSGWSAAKIAAAVAAGTLVAGMLAPQAPSAPGYRPVGPVKFGDVGKVNLPGMNPGYLMTPGLLQPQVPGATGTQAYYNWGTRPLIQNVQDINQWNQAPTTPQFLGAAQAAGTGADQMNLNNLIPLSLGLSQARSAYPYAIASPIAPQNYVPTASVNDLVNQTLGLGAAAAGGPVAPVA